MRDASSDHPLPVIMSDSARLDSLELAVARLTKELVALRTEMRASRSQSAGPAGGGALSASEAGPASIAERASTPFGDAIPPVASSAAGFASGSTEGGTGSAGRDEKVPYVSDELRRIAAASGAEAGGASRSARGSHRGSGAVSAIFAASRAAPAQFQRANLEALVGRYGTLALAAFTILMGIGAFIGWAVKNGLIGPEMRVALGAVASLVMAAVGWRMRRGDSPRFGGVLLALSLAMLHVVCWGAGPLLQLVPSALALAVASVASAGLAWLALREEDQSLFNVGFGGALLAPFVTSSETGDAVILLLYGAVVLAAGMRVMRDREWSKTPFVLGVGIIAYTAAASGQLSQSDAWARGGAPGIFAVATAWLALILVQGKPRERVAVTALLSAVGALGALHQRDSVEGVRYALAALATVSGFLVATGGRSEGIVRLATTLVIPFGALLAATITVDDVTSTAGVALVVLWAIGSAVAAVANRDGGRQWHAFTASALGGLALVLQFAPRELTIALALAAYGAAASLVMRQFRLRGAGLATFGWLLAAAALAFAELFDRGRWLTNPFVTPASGVAAAVCAAWLVFSWQAARTGAPAGGVVTTLPRTVVRILGAVLTFTWVHVELSHTVSIDVSTFLLVAYYAVTGVLAIGVGRWRAIPILRQLGLALSVLAAIKAMVETSALSIGWRVGGYLLAGVFLLGVAYWYRGRGAAASAPGPGEFDAKEAGEATGAGDPQ